MYRMKFPKTIEDFVYKKSGFNSEDIDKRCYDLFEITYRPKNFLKRLKKMS